MFFRTILEFLFTIVVILVVRSVLNGLMKGFSSSARPPSSPRSSGRRPPEPAPAPAGPQISGELHKDPVCGTYVAETTPFRRLAGRQTFYYCSANCREKHALVAQ